MISLSAQVVLKESGDVGVPPSYEASPPLEGEEHNECLPRV